jgi:hypothetical protein
MASQETTATSSPRVRSLAIAADLGLGGGVNALPFGGAARSPGAGGSSLAPPGAAAAALQTSEALRSILADVRSGDDEIGRMLRELTAGSSPSKSPTPAGHYSTPSSPKAGLGKPPLKPATRITTRPTALLSMQTAFDKADTVEEIQRIVSEVITPQRQRLLQAEAGAVPAAEAAALRADREAAAEAASAALAAKSDLEGRLLALTAENARLSELREQLQQDLGLAQSLDKQLSALCSANAALHGQRETELQGAEGVLAAAQAENLALRAQLSQLAAGRGSSGASAAAGLTTGAFGDEVGLAAVMVGLGSECV